MLEHVFSGIALCIVRILQRLRKSGGFVFIAESELSRELSVDAETLRRALRGNKAIKERVHPGTKELQYAFASKYKLKDCDDLLALLSVQLALLMHFCIFVNIFHSLDVLVAMTQGKKKHSPRQVFQLGRAGKGKAETKAPLCTANARRDRTQAQARLS